MEYEISNIRQNFQGRPSSISQRYARKSTQYVNCNPNFLDQPSQKYMRMSETEIWQNLEGMSLQNVQKYTKMMWQYEIGNLT